VRSKRERFGCKTHKREKREKNRAEVSKKKPKNRKKFAFLSPLSVKKFFQEEGVLLVLSFVSK